MKPSDLLERHAEGWKAATSNPFLEAVRDGTLAPEVFATWLTQDYLFVGDELACHARLLAHAPRYAQNLLVRSMASLEAELTWFEAQAREHAITLHGSHHPVTASYRAFFHNLQQEEFPVAITALWAVERAYLESWMGIAPGHPTYREYVEHWANPGFASFVSEFEHIAEKALEGQPHTLDSAIEAAFLNVVQLERAFWQMAWSGGAQ